MTTAPKFEPSPDAAHFRAYDKRVVRMVEAQHRISTSRLANTLLDEERLEQLIEQAKPSVPRAARHLHHLLKTPFRYGHKSASRFRAAGEKPGIFYASEHEQTCVAETAYWRLRFFSASPGMTLPTTTTEFLSFSVRVAADRTLDLTRAPYDAEAALWTQDRDYGPCQRFAHAARALNAQLIRYVSVRDDAGGANIALFDPAALVDPVPKTEAVWHFRFRGDVLVTKATSTTPRHMEYTFAQFGLAAPR